MDIEEAELEWRCSMSSRMSRTNMDTMTVADWRQNGVVAVALDKMETQLALVRAQFGGNAGSDNWLDL